MALLQAPPTYAEVVLVNPVTGKGKFNPVWLKWFLDLAQILNESGGTSTLHNSLTSIQGGSASERYHLTAALATLVAALGTISSQAANNVAITGGTINGTSVGGTTRAAGAFTSLSAAGVFRPADAAGAAQTVVSLYAGNGAPNNANGANGDYFLRGDGTVGGNTAIYHKEAGAWVAAVTT